MSSLNKGLDKIDVNKSVIKNDLDHNWVIVAEAIQTILRREMVLNPYELLKDLTRGNMEINQKSLSDFIEKLPVSNNVKEELKSISPHNYLGNSPK